MFQLPPRAYLSIFFITYSQVDLNKVESKKDQFSKFVIAAIERATPARVIQWVVAEEEHFNGGIYYHMVDRQQKWVAIRGDIFADY